MSINKTWIKNPNKLSDEYGAGVVAFLERAKNFVDETGLVKCPCNKCVNIQLQTINVIEHHLFNNGFLQSYTNWYWHEEEEIIPTNKVVQQCQEDEIMDGLNDIEQPEKNKDDEIVCDYEMNTSEECVCDDDEIATREEIECNDDDGDDDELPTTEENQHDDEIPTDFRDGQDYRDLSAEMEAPLFPGCEKYTSLNFLVKLMYFKGKIPNNIFDELLGLLQDAFPAPNNLPKSRNEAKMLLSKLGPVVGIPETWSTTNHMDDEGWDSKDAEDSYERLKNVLEMQLQSPASSSAASASISMDEEENTALGLRAQHDDEPPLYEQVQGMMASIRAMEEYMAALAGASSFPLPPPPDQDPKAPSQ
ncbi:uncharacterized protein LOC133034747 [Cannabis sativa]|nr:uncharacterized protein LOC133034747 [Cannabis sativa]XP_060966096.1 uncharacterized protein LOC133034747 [Cannabis sativa]